MEVKREAAKECCGRAPADPLGQARSRQLSRDRVHGHRGAGRSVALRTLNEARGSTQLFLLCSIFRPWFHLLVYRMTGLCDCGALLI